MRKVHYESDFLREVKNMSKITKDKKSNSNLSNKKPALTTKKLNKKSDKLDFSDTRNKSLDSVSKEFDGDFTCSNKKLTSLENCPKKIEGNFDCSWNKLSTLEGSPKKVDGNFFLPG